MGSGRVGRTRTIEIDQRAALAVRALIRHRYTAYEDRATLVNWAKGYVRRRPGKPDVKGAPVVTSLPSAGPHQPTIPFVGLSEALVLAAVRRSGVPRQRVRPALEHLGAAAVSDLVAMISGMRVGGGTRYHEGQLVTRGSTVVGWRPPG